MKSNVGSEYWYLRHDSEVFTLLFTDEMLYDALLVYHGGSDPATRVARDTLYPYLHQQCGFTVKLQDQHTGNKNVQFVNYLVLILYIQVKVNRFIIFLLVFWDFLNQEDVFIYFFHE